MLKLSKLELEGLIRLLVGFEKILFCVKLLLLIDWDSLDLSELLLQYAGRGLFLDELLSGQIFLQLNLILVSNLLRW